MGANGAFTDIIMNTDAFIVSDKQIELDMKLVPFDLWAGKVHVLMLGKQKIIKKSVCIKIIKSSHILEKRSSFDFYNEYLGIICGDFCRTYAGFG